jgi:hypothetical protein
MAVVLLGRNDFWKLPEYKAFLDGFDLDLESKTFIQVFFVLSCVVLFVIPFSLDFAFAISGNSCCHEQSPHPTCQ